MQVTVIGDTEKKLFVKSKTAIQLKFVIKVGGDLKEIPKIYGHYSDSCGR